MYSPGNLVALVEWIAIKPAMPITVNTMIEVRRPQASLR